MRIYTVKNPRGKRLKCPKCGHLMLKETYYYCPGCDTSYNPIAANPTTKLYKDFHGAEPRQRKVGYEPPKSPLIKIGRISRIEYRPEWPSSRRDTTYYHDFGQTLTKKLKSNAILATDAKGRNLYIIRDRNGKHPYFSSRGIIG